MGTSLEGTNPTNPTIHQQGTSPSMSQPLGKLSRNRTTSLELDKDVSSSADKAASIAKNIILTEHTILSNESTVESPLKTAQAQSEKAQSKRANSYVNIHEGQGKVVQQAFKETIESEEAFIKLRNDPHRKHIDKSRTTTFPKTIEEILKESIPKAKSLIQESHSCPQSAKEPELNDLLKRIESFLKKFKSIKSNSKNLNTENVDTLNKLIEDLNYAFSAINAKLQFISQK